jgi:hypothetical protein
MNPNNHKKKNQDGKALSQQNSHENYGKSMFTFQSQHANSKKNKKLDLPSSNFKYDSMLDSNPYNK